MQRVFHQNLGRMAKKSNLFELQIVLNKKKFLFMLA